ncbi:JAB domain-containing protein [Bdellovibrio sp. 22V]|uniref:JAB domain-containing protein n=1 Tax=Bdellovibrio sp. 22V TaxID=3044166 RepID=UPI002543459E|nr:JAB domain-containing protein [Bdellovibrio sp. 22V]WII70782.1 JAB domain-containing protein [Bdellovibrio sp. 22V]
MNEVSSSLLAYECLRAQINPFAEEIWILALNSQMEVIKKDLIFRGTADHCLIHPRDIFRSLILCNACSFIMAHNHPSNHTEPSEQDLIITRKIYQASLLLQIPLHDHIVMTPTQYYSMADHGHFKKWRKNFKSLFIEERLRQNQIDPFHSDSDCEEVLRKLRDSSHRSE